MALVGVLLESLLFFFFLGSPKVVLSLVLFWASGGRSGCADALNFEFSSTFPTPLLRGSTASAVCLTIEVFPTIFPSLDGTLFLFQLIAICFLFLLILIFFVFSKAEKKK